LGAGRKVQRRQAVHALAFHPQRLAARRQDVDRLRAPEDFFGEYRGSLDDMLAAVEHDEQFLLLEERDQTRERLVGANADAKLGGEGARHKQRIGQRREIDEADAIPE
jgi:hypothetical protein